MSHSEEIYNMKLHEWTQLKGMYSVLRVPGGWLYTYSYMGNNNTVFVPYNDEFDSDAD
jgi:hypothetical protein